MAAQRSPNYPRLDLAISLELVKKLYDREKLAPFPLESAAAAWGHTVKSGAVRVRMGALRQFGLITRGSRESQLTNHALTLMIRHPQSRQHQDALREAALFPKLFREIHDTRLNASDETLVHYLIADKKFTPDGADRFIKSFRSTMDKAGLAGDGMMDGEDDYDFEEDEDDLLAETLRSHVSSPVVPTAPVTPTAALAPATPGGFMSLPIPLKSDRMITVIMPIEMDESDWAEFDRRLSGYRPLSSEKKDA